MVKTPRTGSELVPGKSKDQLLSTMMQRIILLFSDLAYIIVGYNHARASC